MFLQVSVILFTGGCLVLGGACPGGSGSGGSACYQRGSGPGGSGSGGGGCLLLGGVWSQGVPGGDPLPDGYCCGRYASYWNAFLFIIEIILLFC